MPERFVADHQRATRVFLVDDDAVLRQVTRILLRAVPEIEVVGEAAEADSAIPGIKRERPDVVLLDLHMPGLSGPEAVIAIRRAHPASRVLIMSGTDDPGDVDAVVAAGASGFLLKGVNLAGLVHAVREVSAGRPYYSAERSGRRLDRYG